MLGFFFAGGLVGFDALGVVADVMHGVSGDEVVEDGFEGFQLFQSGRGEEPDA